MTTNSMSFKATAGLVAFLALVGLLTIGSFANAQAASQCVARSAVSGAEIDDLLNKTGSTGVTSGQPLSLAPPTPNEVVGNNSLICTYALVKFVTNLLFFAIVAVSVLLIAWAAFLFVTAGSNPGKRGQARSLLIFAIVGLLIAAVARVIPSVVRGIIGV